MIDEDEVGLQEKPEDTRYIPTLLLLGLRTLESTCASRLKAPSGCVICISWSGGAYNQVFDFGVPQTKGVGVQSF